MDWNGMIETVGSAPTLYWVAASAIAAGTSLLAAAFVLHLRRRAPRRARTPRRPAAPPAAAPAAVAVPGGYAPAAAPAVTPVPALPRADLARVTARLAAVADRLAALEAEIDADRPVSTGSSLKEAPSHVEYVFRTGEA